MASGSIELPSPASESDMFPTSTNGHKSATSSESPNDGFRTDSALSEADAAAPSDVPFSETSSKVPSPENTSQDSPDQQFDASSEDDAEGSDDADYEETANVAVHSPSEPSSPEPSRAKKRKLNKFSKSESDYFRQNPELFGLRHSSRATRKVIIESDSNEDDSPYDEGPKPKKRRTKQAVKSLSHTPNVATPQSDSEDEYIQSRRQQLTKSQKQRQLQVAAGIINESERSTRVDTRRAGLSAKNYNEEDDEEDLDDNAGEYGEEDWTYESQGPQVDIVLNHRLLDGLTYTPHTARDDFEFLIKWQDKAHLHATWHTYQQVKDMGLRMNKLDNYWRQLSSEKGEINIRTNPDIDPEEQEEWFIRREEYLQALNDHQQISRVVASRETENGTEYFVLWKLLQYDKCTWENSELVSRLAQNEIDRYLDRVQNVPRSKPKQNPKFVRIEQQPEYIKHGQLREFQLTGLNFLAHSWVHGKNVILADEMGLGKTVQTVAWLNWLRHAQSQHGPFLVVVPLSTMPAWADTFNKWAPDINFVEYHGNRKSRDIIQQHELLIDWDPKHPKFHVLLTTYELANKEQSFLSLLKWQALVVDEAHRLKNRESKLYEALARFNIGSKLLLTGTPLQNNLSELAALMHFIAPDVVEIDENIDLQDQAAAAQKLASVNSTMRKYMLRRTKKMVMADLPPLHERTLRVVLSDTQLKLSQAILDKNYAVLNAGSNGPKQSLINIVMESKKCSNHPFLFPIQKEALTANCETKEDYLRILLSTSCKMMLLDQLLAKLKSEGHRVLIFTQMVKMLDILGDYLRLRGYKYQRLDGTVPAPARARAMEHFQDPESDDFCFILSTRAGGLGLNLMSADTVIIFDSDWNPQADIQAISRSHRMGQKKAVNAYRFVAQDSIEEKIQQRARNKRILEYLTIQYGYGDSEKKEKEKILQGKGVYTREPTTSADLSKIIYEGSKDMFLQKGNQEKLEQLDIDQVLANAEVQNNGDEDGDGAFLADGGEDFLKSFQYTDVKLDISWDDIIPPDRLEALKAEERKRLEEEETKRLLEQERPRKRKAATLEAREQRAAKKRAREINKEAAAISDEEEDAKADESETEVDPKRPLSVKEIRNLLEAYKKFGFFEDAQAEIVKEARLENRDPEVLKEVLQAAYAEADKLYKDAQDELEAQEQDSTKLPAKKERKEVLFNFRGTKNQNASTIIERPEHLRLMRNAVSGTPDPKSFRVGMARKAADYTCDWGAREDGMLVVGVVKHGYGAWAEIRDDPELGMADKLFLEEKRVATMNENKEKKEKGERVKERKPQATHLVRRVKYLIDCLKVQAGTADSAAMKALENHHRNRKKLIPGDLGDSVSNISSPAARGTTPVVRKPARELDKGRMRGNSRAESQQRTLDRNGAPDLPRKASDESKNARANEPRASLRPQSSHGSKHHSPGGDDGTAHKRRLSGLSNGVEKKPRRESDENERKRRHDGEDEREHKRRKSRDDRSFDDTQPVLNGYNDRARPRLSDDHNRNGRPVRESFEPYDAYDHRRNKYPDDRRRENQSFTNRDRSRSPGRNYRRDDGRSPYGEGYKRDRYDRYDKHDGRYRRDEQYERGYREGREKERQQHQYRTERHESFHRQGHGSPWNREENRRPSYEDRRDEHRNERRDERAQSTKKAARGDEVKKQHSEQYSRHVAEAGTKLLPETKPQAYDDRASKIVDEYLPRLRLKYDLVKKATDRADKSGLVKSWLLLVADIIKKNGVIHNSPLETQIWDYAKQKAWYPTHGTGASLKAMADKIIEKERISPNGEKSQANNTPRTNEPGQIRDSGAQ